MEQRYYTIIGLILLFALHVGPAFAGPRTVKNTYQLPGHAPGELDVAFSHDGRLLAVSDSNNQLTLWDLTQKTKIFQHRQNSRFSPAFSPDNRILLTNQYDKGAYRYWDTASGKEITAWPQLASAIEYIEFGPNMSRIIARSDNGETRLHDARSGRIIKVVPGAFLGGDGNPFALGQGKFLTREDNGLIRQWNARTGEELKPRLHTKPLSADALTAFSPTGKWLITVSLKPVKKATLISLAETRSSIDVRGDVLADVDEHSIPAYEPVPAFNSDETKMLAITPDGRIQLIDTHSGRIVKTFGASQANASRAWFGPDGGYIAAISDSHGYIQVWDARSGRLRHTKHILHEDAANAVFQPNRAADRVVLWDHDGKMQLWDLLNNQKIETLSAEWAGVHFNRTGDLLVLNAQGQPASVWNARIGRLLKRFGDNEETRNASDIEFNRRGDRLAIALDDGIVHVLFFE